MVPRKRRDVGRVKGSTTFPPTFTHVVNSPGFTTLADEIYLEIVSHIPSVPIPTPKSIYLKSYPEIRRSRHETFLSLSQTSRSLHRFFWRYLWQRIEVREGMKFEGKDGTLQNSDIRTSCKNYAIELVRQLEVVTIRNPQLAQYVKWVLLELFALQLDRLWIVTLTYSLAYIQPRPSFLNWPVVWVFSKTYILSRLISIYMVEIVSRNFLNKLSKSFHIHRFVMFSSCVPVYPSLHLAHKRDALAFPEIAFVPYRACKISCTTVLIWKNLKTFVMFFGIPLIATVRNLYLQLHWSSNHFAFPSHCQ